MFEDNWFKCVDKMIEYFLIFWIGFFLSFLSFYSLLFSFLFFDLVFFCTCRFVPIIIEWISSSKVIRAWDYDQSGWIDTQCILQKKHLVNTFFQYPFLCFFVCKSLEKKPRLNLFSFNNNKMYKLLLLWATIIIYKKVR